MTTVNANWPAVSFQSAFNADPNDPAATPTWTELVTRLRTWDSDFGRQYETDTNQAGEAEATLDDADELLNPANTSSPYNSAGNLLIPLRQFVHQAMWPPVPVGSAVNMLNTASGFDPTFETYTAGSAPSWLIAVGGVAPAVSTLNPFSGTQSLRYAVVAAGGQQGPGWQVECIPGQQYTISAEFRQTAANTTQIFISGGATGSSTASINTYVRLTVTFTATQPTHQVYINSMTTGSNANCNIDTIQMETGASASTFSSAVGPVVYGVAAGYVERWPSTWDYNGIRGRCDITCVDATAVLEYDVALGEPEDLVEAM